MANKLIRNRITIFIACHNPELVTGGRHFLILICFMLFGVGIARPQSREVGTANNQNITALNIGDQIPDALWNTPLQVVNHPQDKKNITLADYKGKLIILDFWSTWCGTCVAALPRLHELEKEFKDDVIILPMTDQKANEIKAFLKKNRVLSRLNLFSVTDDNTYKFHFPYTMLPHEVWISKSGEVQAITHSSDVTKENITSALKGNANSIAQKKDNLTYDDTRPLLLNNNGADGDFFVSRSIITLAIEGIPRSNALPKVNEKDSTFRVLSTNADIRRMYELAFRELLTMPPNRTKLELKEPFSVSEKRFLQDKYCYEWIAPLSVLKHFPQKVQADLNYHFGINGRMEKRNTKCYTIKIIGKTTIIPNKPEDGLQYLSAWVNKTNKDIQHIPVVNDFTDEKIAIPKIAHAIEDVEAVNRQLKPFGIAIVEDERVLDFFVISEL
ncbi:TlpA disulfide reductase family protein [Sphingobacterium spiritivorum]|uniref:Redoxin family protein n=2 Tax=Sphingobacterium spiritivorum TaxID=258 RepID=D7VNT5_SPHSI|nr:TlpA disulfide reductase family protein [Sphingobacterium spiritivorum]EFK57582.1 redoxin family protein [Sphingobacterium spiritivorum ATCC 33861]QQT24482.1 TlpA family protein disulfide reductase [Sphingobacterium spiritivorum]QQT36367.1 TlpA family protein disulfide reductase [Sphingobacterium spiritivorum]WQD33114.1 TlpA disulfide reductase family protein [Sphingobacterium spiritivorum]SUJ18960.1 Cytochrome c biogenesis protein tlpA [Sphingobacterium spiritivorum]